MTSIKEVSYENINGGDVKILETILNPASNPNPKAAAILKNIAEGNELTLAKNSKALELASSVYKNILTIIQEK